jgi:hypothetical protein
MGPGGDDRRCLFGGAFSLAARPGTLFRRCQVAPVRRSRRDRRPRHYGGPPHRSASSVASASIATTECAYAPPARISAATQIASMISCSLAPRRCASFA